MTKELKLIYNGRNIYFLYINDKETQKNKLISTIIMGERWENPIIYLYLVPKLIQAIHIAPSFWYDDDQTELLEILNKEDAEEAK